MAIIKTIKVGSTTYDINDSRIADLPLSISQGGTGATTKALAQTALDIDEMLNLGVSASTLISTGTDLDSLTTVGSYYTAGSSATVLNSPAGADAHGYTGGFRLYVMITNASYLHQIFVPSNSNEIWIRRKSNSTTWGDWENINNDTKVSQNTLSTDATFPLVIKGTSATVSVTGTVGFTTVIYSNPNKSNITVQGPANSSSASGAAFRVLPANGNTTVATLMNYEEGTASSVGTGAVVVGNAVASGNVGNAKGMIILYGENKYSSRITSAAASSSKEQTLPNKEGWIPVGGNGSSSGEGSTSTPIYMAADGELKPVTSIDASLISGDIEDEKVKQSLVSSGTSKYPILVKETTNTTTATEGAKFGANLYAMPANAVIAVCGVTGSATDNGSGFAVRNNTDVKTVAKLYEYQDGTSTSVGAGALYLGNTDTTPTVGNARGQLYIASDGAGRTRIQSQATSNRNVELPDAAGYIAIGGNGSSSGVGSASTPIYMDTNGVLTAITGSSLFATFTGATSTTGYSITAKVAEQERTVTIPGASSSQAGLVTTGAQTFGGKKTFENTVYFANTTTYYVGSSGNIRGNNMSSVGTFTAGATLTANGRLVGKFGGVTAGNYTTSVPTAAGVTGQIMFVIQ